MVLDGKLIVTLVTSIIGGIPPTLMALAALRQGKSNGAKADAIAGKADNITEKTTEIHVLTNGNLTKVKDELAAAEARIKALENMVLSLTAGRRQPPVLPTK